MAISASSLRRAMLLAMADAKAAKQHQEDKEVVHAQRCFDHISRDEFERRLMALLVIEPESEPGRDQSDEEAPDPRELGARRILAAMR